MKTNKIYNYKMLLFLPAFGLMMSGCFSFTNFQTGKTIGKGNAEIGMNLSYIGLSDGDVGVAGIPSFEVSGKYGISEKFDLGLRLGNFAFAMAEAKYQVVGDQDSKFASSIGLGVGGSLIAFDLGDDEGFGLFQVEVPFHMSYHPTEKFAFYFTPKYLGIGGFAGGESGMSHLIGFCPGVEFGKKVKFGVNVNLFAPLNEFTLSGGLLTNFGFGVKFTF